MAPISPSSPYETRSPSSTCAGSPDPSRPATYFTSGAYVRISRSRSALSPLRKRYSRQRDWVLSASATRERIRAVSALPECSERHRREPDREGDGGQGDGPPRADAPGSLDGREGDPCEGDRQQREERAECTALLQRPRNLTARTLANPAPLRGAMMICKRQCRSLRFRPCRAKPATAANSVRATIRRS